VRLKSGKTVHAWAIEGDINQESIVSDLFEMEWPPKSGKKQSFPEIDRAGWFNIDDAKIKLNAAQAAFIDELISTEL
jgi:predicted NUDIX family NTP pyrophosphohydrolase